MSLKALMDLPEALSRFVPRHDTLLLNLRETSPDQLIGSAIASVLRVVQVERAPLERLQQVLASAIQALDDLPEDMGAERREAFYYLLLLILHRRAPEEQEQLVTTLTAAVRKHREEVDEMKKMSAIETWLQESRQEGELKGLLKGLLGVLQARFGPLPQHVPSKLENLSVNEVEALLARAATASSLAELDLDD